MSTDTEILIVIIIGSVVGLGVIGYCINICFCGGETFKTSGVTRHNHDRRRHYNGGVSGGGGGGGGDCGGDGGDGC